MGWALDLHCSQSSFSLNGYDKPRELSHQPDAMDASSMQVVEEQDNLVVCDRNVDDFKLQEHVADLNADQRAIFHEVVHALKAQDKSEQIDIETQQIRLFVSGTAGTGKTFLIKALADQVASKYGSGAVLLAASTGIAALKIRGRTCHSAFSIAVGRWKLMDEVEDAEKLRENRAHFAQTRLVIIDEISMISIQMLRRINSRLQQFCDPDKQFGGKNVILFGDLLQLPPVQARWIFDEDTGESLFSSFAYRELIANMRQGSDALGDIMLRARVQALTDDDVRTLRSRLISPSVDTVSLAEAVAYFVRAQASDPTIMALFGTNDDVHAFNQLVADAKDMQVVRIPAVRTSDKHTWSAPLHIAVEGRVMLRRNIDIELGLVNGATGTLKDIDMDQTGRVRSLWIRFDGHRSVTKVLRMSSFNRTGWQFPIVMAFAATVHKCQGLTLTNAMISMDGYFGRTPGMAFVALSRVRTLAGLHLVNLYEKKVKCSVPALIKYNELRGGIGLAAIPIPVPLPKMSRSGRKGAHSIAPPRNSHAMSRRKVANSVALQNVNRAPMSPLCDKVPSSEENRSMKDCLPPDQVDRSRAFISFTVPADNSIFPSPPGTNEASSDPLNWEQLSISSPSEIEISPFFDKASEVNANVAPSITPPPEKQISPFFEIESADAAYRFEDGCGSVSIANAVVNMLLSLTSLVDELSALQSGTNQIANLLIEASKRGENSKDVPQRLKQMFPEFAKNDSELQIVQCLDIVREDGTNIMSDFDVDNVQLDTPLCRMPRYMINTNVEDYDSFMENSFDNEANPIHGTQYELVSAILIDENQTEFWRKLPYGWSVADGSLLRTCTEIDNRTKLRVLAFTLVKVFDFST